MATSPERSFEAFITGPLAERLIAERGALPETWRCQRHEAACAATSVFRPAWGIGGLKSSSLEHFAKLLDDATGSSRLREHSVAISRRQ
jgi:hypothetical protein